MLIGRIGHDADKVHLCAPQSGKSQLYEGTGELWPAMASSRQDVMSHDTRLSRDMKCSLGPVYKWFSITMSINCIATRLGDSTNLVWGRLDWGLRGIPSQLVTNLGLGRCRLWILKLPSRCKTIYPWEQSNDWYCSTATVLYRTDYFTNEKLYQADFWCGTIKEDTHITIGGKFVERKTTDPWGAF